MGSGQKEKVGQCSEETAPFQSGQSYFFFAFLAFLAAFFAFFAIGLIPPFRLGLRKVDAAPQRGVCRLALSPRMPAPRASFSRESADSRAMCCPLAVG